MRFGNGSGNGNRKARRTESSLTCESLVVDTDYENMNDSDMCTTYLVNICY